MNEKTINGVEVVVKDKELRYNLPKGMSGTAFREWKLLNKREVEEILKRRCEDEVNNLKLTTL